MTNPVLAQLLRVQTLQIAQRAVRLRARAPLTGARLGAMPAGCGGGGRERNPWLVSLGLLAVLSPTPVLPKLLVPAEALLAKLAEVCRPRLQFRQLCRRGLTTREARDA